MPGQRAANPARDAEEADPGPAHVALTWAHEQHAEEKADGATVQHAEKKAAGTTAPERRPRAGSSSTSEGFGSTRFEHGE